MQLSRVIIFTGDVRRMVDFYTATFGLTMIGEFDEGLTEVNAGSCTIAFHKLGFDVDGSTDDGVKLVFGTDDVAGEKARLESLGIKMTEIYNTRTSSFVTAMIRMATDFRSRRAGCDDRGLKSVTIEPDSEIILLYDSGKGGSKLQKELCQN